jgi:hypothetical protein
MLPSILRCEIKAKPVFELERCFYITIDFDTNVRPFNTS